MRATIHALSLSLTLTLSLSLAPLGASRAATLSYPLSLNTPKLVSLQTSLNPTGGAVSIELNIKYDLAGAASFTGMLDGLSVAGKPTLKTTGTNTTYKFSLRGTTTPATIVSISGTVGVATASCSYSGPKGRTNVMANTVSITTVQPVPATLELSPVISEKNVITGAAQINADYTTNPIVNGTVKGKVSSNLVSLAIKQDKRSAAFTGQRSGNAYVGDLRLTVPPARETIKNFSLPLTDISVAAGSASFQGTLSFISNRLPAPAAGATVTIRSDLNGDGKFLGKEIVTGIADQDGHYRISTTVLRGRKVFFEVRRPGYAEILHSYSSVAPGSDLMRNATLQSLEEMQVSGGTVEASDGSIRLEGLPAEIETVEARVFDPGADAAQFPGSYADNQGNLLVSSVFSSIEATDSSGRAVTNLGPNATLCMKVPPSTWPTLGDLTPGNGQIDVPLYFYDENDGEWKRHSSDGWLEDASHIKIAEGQLAAIRGGTFVGDVCAVGPISHLSWWNIDWPISSHTCIKGLIVDTNGLPVAGASVSVVGLTYSGRTGPATTGSDGSFCLEIMRSEANGEDVDGDNVPGETQKVQLRVGSSTNQFALGPFSSPLLPATCESGTGLNLGSVVLSDEQRVKLSFCSITGRVVYSGVSVGGTPIIPVGGGVRFAQVVGYDPEALNAGAALCTNCLVTTTDSQGYFGLQMPLFSGASLFALANVSGASGYGLFVGELTTVGCPGDPVTIEADYFHSGSVPITLLRGGQSWGTATLQGGAIVVIIYPDPGSSLYYIGSQNSVALPTQLGAWVSLPLRNGTPGTYIGTITFTVTSVVPAGGTWEIQGGSVKAEGTWSVPSLGL